MDVITPTTSDLHSWSKVDFANLDDPVDDALLTILIARSVAYIGQVTGRDLPGMPTALETIAQETIQRRTEQLAFQYQEDAVDTGADELISTFSAGSYSETKRDPQDFAGVPGMIPPVNRWPALNDLLWLLMTDDKRDEWRALLTDETVPSFEVTEVDWGNWGLDPDFFWGA